MKRFFLRSLFFLILLNLATQNGFSYMVKYKEDYYKLFHVHYQQYPDDVMENIYWLEQAVKADFCNPLYTGVKIEDEKDWEKYRYLFMMHINLKLIEQHLRLGRTYDHKVAKFYDAPWKDLYIENLKKTLSCYEAGLYYWQEAKLWAEKANVPRFQFLTLQDIQNWEDERERIFTGKLNYQKILNREISRVKKVIADFEAMTNDTY
ncbi:hypothetical protein [Treponema pectinovorum]|uniref:hypothetical protein n=1 Tax=Treponema pectinovorum TaxID=164 RepID=UPI0036F2C420